MAGRQDPEPGGSRRLAGRRLDRHRDDELQPVRDGVRQDQADRCTRKVLTIEVSAGLLPFRRRRSGRAVVGELSGRAGQELGRRRARRSRPGQPKHHAEGKLSGAPQDHWGGETIIRAGFKEVSIQGVEFSYIGKPKLGSYPAHFHMIGAIGKTRRPCSTPTASIIPTTSASPCIPPRTWCSRTTSARAPSDISSTRRSATRRTSPSSTISASAR